MTAGLFHHHGVWTGGCRPPGPYNDKGFFENIKIKKIIVKEHKAIVQKSLLATEKPGFRERVEQAILEDGYIEGPWLWKGSAMYWPAFFEFDCQFVVVNRPREQIFKSTRRSGMLSKALTTDELYANIDFHQQQMDYLVEEKDAVRVNTAELVNGDFTSIEAALTKCGLEFNEQVTLDFVEPKLWHYHT